MVFFILFICPIRLNHLWYKNKWYKVTYIINNYNFKYLSILNSIIYSFIKLIYIIVLFYVKILIFEGIDAIFAGTLNFGECLLSWLLIILFSIEYIVCLLSRMSRAFRFQF